MNSTNGPQPTIEQLAEEFLERYRQGERPALTEYKTKYPELAAEIQEVFSALALVEQAGAPDPNRPTTFRGKVTADGKTPCQLGDYRILREVGRGGMGVIYEAVQESLNRHVALKVLPYDAIANRTCLERFTREARAAARLHHTNIVPVHDVGEHEGIRYYAMQFIEGKSLDEVILELQRLRRMKAAPAAAPGLAREIATGLWGGSAGSECRTSNGSMAGREPEPSPPSVPSPVTPRADASASTAVGATGSGDLSNTSDVQYYRAVARLGMQVAEALAYAHSQKVLHRDIKPSNLLLDRHGTIWVTDFGLAKEEGTNLTEAGDVVGTLRYLAPERFNGVSDVRGDVYSLGLTLYEMLSLQPAFNEGERGRLIRRIAHEDPPALRKFDRRTPRDLETIVLKAIAKDPKRRYQTAQELAEDLRLFQADRPIMARRVRSLERAWRWMRRNPGWAATLAAAILFLVIIAIGGIIQNINLQAALTSAQQAQREKTDKLWRSYVESARAERSSGRVGQRFAALRAIREATKIRVDAELRDEAAAALVLPDAEVASAWEGYPAGTLDLAFDASYTRYARLDKRGVVTVCRLSDAAEEVVTRLPSFGRPKFYGLWMSPDGRFLAHGHSCLREAVAGGLRIWRLDGPRPTILADVSAGANGRAVAFDAQSRRLAVGHPDGTMSFFELEPFRLARRLAPGWVAQNLAFHPAGGRLAAACGDTARLFDFDTGRELTPFRRADRVTWIEGLAWHPGGLYLAAGCNDGQIHIWDAASSEEVLRTSEQQYDLGVHLSFSHSGHLLASADWSGSTKLWDTNNGRLVLTLPEGIRVRFSADDDLLGFNEKGSEIQLWRVAGGRELQILSRRHAEPGEQLIAPAPLADGRSLVTVSRHRSQSALWQDRLCVFDLDSGAELASALLGIEGAASPMGCDRDGTCLTSGRGGFLAWPERSDPLAGLCLGPPIRVSAALRNFGIGFANRSGVFAVPFGDHALVLDRDRPGWRGFELKPLYDVRQCAVSPDGRWIVTCGWFWDGRTSNGQVWDATTGRHVADLPLEALVMASFSPDGRWLVTYGGGRGSQFWEVGTWRPGQRSDKGRGVFSPDSKIFAIGDVLGAIRFVEADTGREVFRLAGPEPTFFGPAFFTPDGTRLAATANGQIYVWDLRLLRDRLRSLGMDWDWPQFSSADPRPSPPKPPVTRVDPGFLRAPWFNDERQTIAATSLCLALQPVNPEAYFGRAVAERRLGSWREALGDFDHFLALAPRNDSRRPEAKLLCALIQRARGDHAAAAAALRDVSSADRELIPWPEEFALACNDVAWHYAKGGHREDWPENVVALALKAVQLAPGNGAFQNTLGAIYHRAGRFAEAIACLEDNLARGLDWAAFDLYVLALSYSAVGEVDKARDCFERASAFHKKAVNLPPEQAAELKAFRAEAAAALHLDRSFTGR